MKILILLSILSITIPSFAGLGTGGGGGGVEPIKDGKVINNNERQSNNNDRARSDFERRLQNSLISPTPIKLRNTLSLKVVDGKLVIDLGNSKIQDIKLADGTIIDVESIRNEEEDSLNEGSDLTND